VSKEEYSSKIYLWLSIPLLFWQTLTFWFLYKTLMHKVTTPCILGDLILGGFQYMFYVTRVSILFNVIVFYYVRKAKRLGRTQFRRNHSWSIISVSFRWSDGKSGCHFSDRESIAQIWNRTMIRDWDTSHLYSPEIWRYSANFKFDTSGMTVRDSYVKRNN